MFKKFLILAALPLLALVMTSCGKPKEAPKKAGKTVSGAGVAASFRGGTSRPAAVKPLAALPTVVIIIDDMGNNLKALDDVLALPGPVAVAVLPLLKDSGATARKAESAGLIVLLHMPMQPKGNPRGLGPGALLVGMSPGDINEILSKDLASVPGAEGVNNHMGSLLTEDKAAMAALMAGLKSRKLFFVDSLTTAGSVAWRMAKKEGVPYARRDIFLDDSPDEAYIKAQFARLVRLAKKKGVAVAIGHPRPMTMKVLGLELQGLSKQGVRLAKISEVLKK
ncbi:MAG: divergent polysaccharide deacetylase family protein [Nitrospirota bacterium]